MKKVIVCLLTLTILLGTLLIPMSASAVTVNDLYDKFKTLPVVGEYYDETVKKFMKLIPVSDEQAAQMMVYMDRVHEIIDPVGSFEPLDYTNEERWEVVDCVKKAAAVVGVEVTAIRRAPGERISEKDDYVLQFSYEGKVILVYDGDELSKTGTDVSPVLLYVGIGLLAAAVVVFVIARKKSEA